MIFLIISILVIFYYRIFFLGESFFLGDNLLIIAPHKIFVWESLKRGILPFWNPYKSAGFPELADITLGLFNPFNFLHFIFPGLRGINAVALVAYFLAFLGTYLFLRNESLRKRAALLGGIVFTFSGSMINIALDIIRIESICFLPWMLLAVRKRRYLTTIILLTLNFLVGQTQHYYMSIVFILGFLLLVVEKRQKIKQSIIFLTSVGFSLLLSAFALLPQLELIGLSSREKLDFAYNTTWSMHPASLVRFFLADFWGRRQDGSFWGPNVTYSFGYVGFFTLVLILANIKKINRKSLYFVIAAIASLMIAFGKFNPVYKYFLLIPGFSLFRNPSSWLIIYSFSLACLLAFLADKLNFKKVKLKKMMFFGGLVMVVVGLSMFILGKYSPLGINKLVSLLLKVLGKIPLSLQSPLVMKEIMILIGRNLSILGLLVWVFYKRFSLTGLIVVVLLDLFFFSTGDLFLAKNVTNLFKQTEQMQHIQFLKENLGPYRFVSTNEFLMVRGIAIYQDEFFKRPPFYTIITNVDEEERSSLNNFRKIYATLSPDNFVAYSLPSINSYSSFSLKDYQDYFSNPSENLSKELRIIQKGFQDHSQPPDPTKINFNFITFDDPRLTELSVKYILSREFLPLVNFQEVYHDDGFYIYENPQTPPRAQVFDEKDNLMINPEIIDINPNVVEVNLNDYQYQNGDYLLLRDKYYPDWQAFDQNNDELKIEPEKIFRKVKLKDGVKKVKFYFKPKSFYLGLKVSLASLVILLIIWLGKTKKIFGKLKS